MGEALALLAAERGAKASVADVDKAAAQIVVDKIKASGGDAIALKCNVASAQDVRAAIKR